MESKKAKTPPISGNTKLLSFDLETNGLHGSAFAVGAVVMDINGKVHDQFTGRCSINGKVDDWVAKNVLPAIENMPITHKSYEHLREDFWQWYLQAEPKSDYVLVNNGYPVEYRFLLQCQEKDIEGRYWQHPFPILDLSSLLIQVGKTNLANKSQLFTDTPGQGKFSKHNPLDDAKVAALTAFEAFKLSGRIS